MDPLALLDFEKRNGYSTKDIDQFVTKVDKVAEVMEKIKSGEFKDEDFDTIPGFKSQKQKEQEEEARCKRLKEQKRKETERKEQEKRQEHEEWWYRARLCLSLDENNDSKSIEEPEEYVNRIIKAYQNKDANDYSQWRNWEPQDPVTMEERAKRDALLEKMKNEEFEKANPDFCTQFKEDLETRQLNQRQKERGAMQDKEKGNVYYKRKMYNDAIKLYMKALRALPHQEAILTNLAQCYLRLGQLDDALEFCNRVLFVNPKHVKGLSRRAATYYRQGRLDLTLKDINAAVELAPDNPDLLIEQRSYQGEWDDNKAEEALKKRISTTKDTESFQDTQLVIFDQLLDAYLTEKETKGLYQAMNLMMVEEDMKIMLRTKGVLTKLMNEFEEWIQEEDHDTAQLADVIQVLTTASKENRRNQEVLCVKSILDAVYTLLTDEKHRDLRRLGVSLLYECVDLKLWKTKLSGKKFINAMYRVLDEELKQENTEKDYYLKQASILLVLSGSPASIKQLETTSPEPMSVLTSVLDRENANPSNTSLIRESVCGILSNLSTSRVFQSRVDTRVCRVLLRIIKAHESNSEEGCVRALAALLNFTIEKTSKTRQELYNIGAIPVLLNILKGTETRTLFMVRTAALLSRFISVKEAEPLLSYDSSIAILVKKFTLATTDLKTKEHLSRILAAYMSDHLNVRECMMKHGGVDTIFQLLPSAKIEAVTSQETTQADCRKDAVLLANVAKCLIPLIDQMIGSCPEAIDQFLETDYLARLVETLKELDDGPARKNIAIVLAKLCTNPTVKAQVRQLRGLEILMSLAKSSIPS